MTNRIKFCDHTGKIVIDQINSKGQILKQERVTDEAVKAVFMYILKTQVVEAVEVIEVKDMIHEGKPHKIRVIIERQD